MHKFLITLITMLSFSYPVISEEENIKVNFLYTSDIGSRFEMTPDGPRGVLAEYINKLLIEARIDPNWTNLSWVRSIQFFKDNSRAVCSHSYIKTVEREKYLSFSEHFKYSRGTVIVARKDTKGVSKFGSLNDLFNSDLIGAAEKGVSHTTSVDALINRYELRIEDVTSRRFLSLIANGEFDYGIMTRDYVDNHINDPVNLNSLMIYDHLDGLSQRDAVYFVCSKKTPQEVLSRINDAIKRIGILPSGNNID